MVFKKKNVELEVVDNGYDFYEVKADCHSIIYNNQDIKVVDKKIYITKSAADELREMGYIK